MLLSEAHFPGKYDKVLWTAAFILLFSPSLAAGRPDAVAAGEGSSYADSAGARNSGSQRTVSSRTANMMRLAIGCATCIAAVAFVVGLIVSMFHAVSLPEGLAAGGFVAAIAFVAALFLCWCDYIRYAATHRRVRNRLLARDDCSEDEFMRCFPSADRALVQQTRVAIAQFFDVPVGRIHPGDKLQADYGFAVLESAFRSVVVGDVLDARGVQLSPFCHDAANLRAIAELERQLPRDRLPKPFTWDAHSTIGEVVAEIDSWLAAVAAYESGKGDENAAT